MRKTNRAALIALSGPLLAGILLLAGCFGGPWGEGGAEQPLGAVSAADIEALLTPPAEFFVGDTVTWRRGLRSGIYRDAPEVAVVVEVLVEPRADQKNDYNRVSFYEPLTMKVGLLGEDGNYLEHYVDGRRLEKTNKPAPRRLLRLRDELERGQALAAGTVATWKPGLMNRYSKPNATILVLEQVDPPLIVWDESSTSAQGEKMDVRAAVLEPDGDLEFRYLDSRRLKPTRDGEEIKTLVEAYNQKPTLTPGDRVYWRPRMRNHWRPEPDETLIVTAVLTEPIINPEPDPFKSEFREPLDVRGVYSGQAESIYEVYMDSHRLEKVEEP